MKKSYFASTILMLLLGLVCQSQSWVTQNLNPVNAGFLPHGVSVVDNNVVWCSGYVVPNDVYYSCRSLDGGNTWSTYPVDTDRTVFALVALSGDTAWSSSVSLSGVPLGNYDGAIYKTTNGGQTWIKNTTLPLGITSYVDWMYFFNSNDGVVFGDVNGGNYEVYYTSDGGNSWSAATVPAPLNGEFVWDRLYYPIGDNIWCTSSRGRVFKSTDKGHTWTVSTLSNIQPPLTFRMAFYDAMNGIAVIINVNTNLAVNVYKTTDGGVTWSLVPHTGTVYQDYLYGGLFVVPGTSVVIANSGATTLYGSSYSVDTGATWITIDATNFYGAISGKNWNSLWAGQYSNTLGVGGVAKWDGVALDLNNLVAHQNFSVFPNPSDGLITLSIPKSMKSNFKVSVMNVYGSVAFEKIFTAAQNNFYRTIDLKALPSGIYFINVFDGETNYSQKLVRD